MMKPVLVLGLLLCLSSPAFADRGIEPTQKHIYSTRMSCDSVRGAVSGYGAVILHYGRDLYERVVAHSGYCAMGETAMPFWAPSASRSHCFVGYTCETRNDGF